MLQAVSVKLAEKFFLRIDRPFEDESRRQKLGCLYTDHNTRGHAIDFGREMTGANLRSDASAESWLARGIVWNQSVWPQNASSLILSK